MDPLRSDRRFKALSRQHNLASLLETGQGRLQKVIGYFPQAVDPDRNFELGYCALWHYWTPKQCSKVSGGETLFFPGDGRYS